MDLIRVKVVHDGIEPADFDLYFTPEELGKLRTPKRYAIPNSDPRAEDAIISTRSHTAFKYFKEMYEYYPDKILRTHYEHGEPKDCVFAGCAYSLARHRRPIEVMELQGYKMTEDKLQATSVMAVCLDGDVCFVHDYDCCFMCIDHLFPGEDDDPNQYDTFMESVGGPFKWPPS